MRRKRRLNQRILVVTLAWCLALLAIAIQNSSLLAGCFASKWRPYVEAESIHIETELPRLLTRISEANGKWFLSGGNSLWVSDDLSHWRRALSYREIYIGGVAYGDEKWRAVGSVADGENKRHGAIWTSSDGYSWAGEGATIPVGAVEAAFEWVKFKDGNWMIVGSARTTKGEQMFPASFSESSTARIELDGHPIGRQRLVVPGEYGGDTIGFISDFAQGPNNDLIILQSPVYGGGQRFTRQPLWRSGNGKTLEFSRSAELVLKRDGDEIRAVTTIGGKFLLAVGRLNEPPPGKPWFAAGWISQEGNAWSEGIPIAPRIEGAVVHDLVGSDRHAVMLETHGERYLPGLWNLRVNTCGKLP